MKRSWISLVLLLLLSGSLLAADDVVVFQFDPAHSEISFTVRHLMINKVRGQFNTFTGEIYYDRNDITKSSVKVTIEAASIDTDNERRDNHLRSQDFLYVEKYPKITFVSKKIVKKDNGYVAVGDLTIRGVTKEVEVPFTLVGEIKDPWGNQRIGVEGSLVINRQDFGVSWNNVMDNGGLVVANEVNIEFNIEAVAKKE